MRTILCIWFSIFVWQLYGQSVDENRLKRDVYYLASNYLQGRGTGTEGERRAAEYIASAFESMGLQPRGEENTYFHTFPFQTSTTRHGDGGETIEGVGINVVGYLDNEAPYTVIIGAHYDHLGRGEYGNTREPDKKGYVFYGADDNASGVAGVLAMAEYFSGNDRRENVNFLFMCYSGEELGLIGSKKYIESPTYDLQKVNYMINLDMIGRLNQDRRLLIHGVGTAEEWVPLIQSVEQDFKISMDSSGVGPSDYTSFYLSNIPVLHFYTGAHADYHTTKDTPDLINYTGKAEVIKFIIQIIEATESRPKFTFRETVNKQTETPRFKVTLGVMPDYGWQAPGLKLDAVTSGRPAEKAGLQQGDVILSIGEYAIQSIQDYMKILGAFEKGDKAPAKIQRGEEVVELIVEF